MGQTQAETLTGVHLYSVGEKMTIALDLQLSSNDAEALLRHAESFKASSGDAREDRRLEAALETLRDALRAQLLPEPADGL